MTKKKNLLNLLVSQQRSREKVKVEVALDSFHKRIKIKKINWQRGSFTSSFAYGFDIETVNFDLEHDIFARNKQTNKICFMLV